MRAFEWLVDEGRAAGRAIARAPARAFHWLVDNASRCLAVLWLGGMVFVLVVMVKRIVRVEREAAAIVASAGPGARAEANGERPEQVVQMLDVDEINGINDERMHALGLSAAGDTADPDQAAIDAARAARGKSEEVGGQVAGGAGGVVVVSKGGIAGWIKRNKGKRADPETLAWLRGEEKAEGRAAYAGWTDSGDGELMSWLVKNKGKKGPAGAVDAETQKAIAEAGAGSGSGSGSPRAVAVAANGGGSPVAGNGGGSPLAGNSSGSPFAGNGSGSPVAASGSGSPLAVAASGSGSPLAAGGSGSPLAVAASGSGSPLAAGGRGSPLAAAAGGSGSPLAAGGSGSPLAAGGSGSPLAAAADGSASHSPSPSPSLAQPLDLASLGTAAVFALSPAAAARQRQALLAALRARLAATPATRALTAQLHNRQLLIRLPIADLFASPTAPELSLAGADTMRRLGAIVSALHARDLEIRGDADRALELASALVVGGVDPDRLALAAVDPDAAAHTGSAATPAGPAATDAASDAPAAPALELILLETP